MDWTTFGALGALALAVQRCIEFIRDALDADGSAPKWLWGAVAIGLGVLGVFAADVRIEGFSDSEFAKVITGFFVGGGSNIAHGTIKRLKGTTGRTTA